MKDLIARLEDRRKNLIDSILKIQGIITNQLEDLKSYEKSLSETIGRQRELDKIIAELKSREIKQ